MKFIKILMSLCLIGLFVGTANVSDARDWKVFPGTACHWLNYVVPNAPAVNTMLVPDFLYSDTGSVYANANPRTSNETYLTCPVLRDNPTDTNAQLNLKVRVRDSASNTSVACTLVTASPDGLTFQSAYQSSGISFVGFKEMTFSGITATTAYGSYVMNCIIPPNSKVISYISREESTTETN